MKIILGKDQWAQCKGLLCCYLKSHLQQRAHEENANGYFCICCILFVLDLEEHVYTNTQIQMLKYKHILMDDMNGYLYICWTQLILRCKTVAFETESVKQAKKYNFLPHSNCNLSLSRCLTLYFCNGTLAISVGVFISEQTNKAKSPLRRPSLRDRGISERPIQIIPPLHKHPHSIIQIQITRTQIYKYNWSFHAALSFKWKEMH